MSVKRTNLYPTQLSTQLNLFGNSKNTKIIRQKRQTVDRTSRRSKDLTNRCPQSKDIVRLVPAARVQPKPKLHNIAYIATILRKKKLRSNVIKKTRQTFLKTVNTHSHHNTIRKLIPMIYYTVMKQVSVTNILHMALLPLVCVLTEM